MRFLGFVFLLFLQSGIAFVRADSPRDPVWLEDLDNFADKPVAVLWRGTHLLREHFPNHPARMRYWEAQTVGEPIYATAAYKKTQIPLGTAPNARQQILLYNAATNIQGQIRGLSQKGPILINDHAFEKHRYGFQHIYSNDYDLFGRLVTGAAPTKYGALVSGLDLGGNPFVSCSESIVHSGKYAFGMKYYGDNVTILEPNYDATGRPVNPFLGVLHGMVLDEVMLREVLPFSVPAHHAAGHIRVSTHYTCNILTEREVSLVGRVPPGAVVLEYPITVPSFSGDYDGVYREQYGLTLRRFNNIKAVLTDEQTKPAKKKEKVSQMMEQILASPRRDKAGYHKCTLAEKLTTQMGERLEDIGAEVWPIGVEGTLEYE